MTATNWRLIPDGMYAISDNSEMHTLVVDLSNSGLPTYEVKEAVKRLAACWNEHDDLIKERDALVRAANTYIGLTELADMRFQDADHDRDHCEAYKALCAALDKVKS